ncbi:MAG: polysaccharide deacetylase family protein [Burkholderiales bacterium]
MIFHRVLARPDPLRPFEPDRERFREVAAWLSDWFRVLPLGEAIARLRSGSLPSRAAAITFDDGYADNLHVAAPVLSEFGLPATCFVATGFLDGGRMWNDTIIESVRGARSDVLRIPALDLALPVTDNAQKTDAIARLIGRVKHLPPHERADAVAAVSEAAGATLPTDLMLTSDELRALRATGVTIGAHTVTHPILAAVDEADARREIADGRDRLASLLREPIDLFAYPNGRAVQDYGSVHVAMVRQAGFSAAVSTNWGACSAKSDVFQLPRFTPWDKQRVRFGLRMLANLRQREATAVLPARAPDVAGADASGY